MSRIFNVGLGWLKGTRVNASMCCMGAVAGFTMYFLVSDKWISVQRRSILDKRRKLAEDSSIIADAVDEKSRMTPAEQRFGSLRIGGRFVNPFETWRDKTLWDFVYWLLTRKSGNGLPSDKQQIANALPVFHPNFTLLNAFSRPGLRTSTSIAPQNGTVDDTYADQPDPSSINADDHITATWFGQSTCFVQMEGLNILTDPIFKRRTVFSWLGPERLRPVPCQLRDLPRPDIVLVSHNHFDHLDVDVVKELGNTVTWFVPLGMRDWFARRGVYRVREMDWWQESQFEIPETRRKFTIACAPTQHWSGRTGFDSNCSLWSSFLVKGESKSFFHCGDTGYCDVFKEIGKKYGPVSLAALPIGSYSPRWYMCHQHIDPEDAVVIHKDLRAANSIGVHWATFMMSDEHYLAPPKDLAAACEKFNLSPEKDFIAPQFGKTLIY